MSPGTSKPFARLTSSSAARRSWLIWTCSCVDVARAGGHALEERLADRRVGVVDDRGDVAVVVLQRVVLAAVEAALDSPGRCRIASDARARRGRPPGAMRAVWRSGGRWPPPRAAVAGRRGRAAARCALVWARHPRRRTTTTALRWERGRRPVCRRAGPDAHARRGERQVARGEQAGGERPPTARTRRGHAADARRRGARGGRARRRRRARRARHARVLGRYRLVRRSARAASASCGWRERRAARARRRGQAHRDARRRGGRARRARGARGGAAGAPRRSSPSTSRAATTRPSTWSPSSCAGARSPSSCATARCPTATSLRIGVALCDALAHAHGRGVIHRDVKPQNVIVPDAAAATAAGVAKLTDFGVARMVGDDALTAHRRRRRHARLHGARAGRRARRSGEEADLYALGLVLYEALSGVNPVRGARRRGDRAARRGARCRALGRLRRDLPLELCRAIDRAVLARPERARHARATCARRSRRRCRTPTTSAARSPAARSRAWPRPAAAARAAPDGAARRGGAAPRARLAARRARVADAARSRRSTVAARGRLRAAAGAGRRCALPRLGWLADGGRALAAWAGGRDARSCSRPARRVPTVAAPAPRRARCGRCRAGAPLLGRRRPRRRLAGARGPGRAAVAARRARARSASGGSRSPRSLHRRRASALGARRPGRAARRRSTCDAAASRAARSPSPRSGPPPRWLLPSLVRGRRAGGRRRRRDGVGGGAGLGRRRPSRDALSLAARRCAAWSAGAVVAGGRRGRRRGVTGRGVRAFRLVASPHSGADSAPHAAPSGTPRRHERPAQPRGQDRRPRRGDVRPRLPHRGAPGRDRAQARARDGGAQDGLGLAHLRARTSTSSGSRPEDRAALRGRRARGRRRARRPTCSSTPAASGSRSSAARRSSSAPTSACASASSASRRGSCGRAAAPSAESSRATTGHTMVYSTAARVAGGAATTRATPRARPRDARGRGQALRRRRRAARRIGRSRECDIVLDDPNVSRRHAEVRPPGDGWIVTDLGSTNGVRSTAATCVERPQALKRGDRIELGTVDATLRGGVMPAMVARAGLRRPEVRLPRRALPVPAVGRAQRAEGPARRAAARRPPPAIASARPDATGHARRRRRCRPRRPARRAAAASSSARPATLPAWRTTSATARVARARRPGRDPARGPLRVLAARAARRARAACVVLEDLGSTNGTYLNEEPLARPAAAARRATASASATASSPTRDADAARRRALRAHRHRPPAPGQRGRLLRARAAVRRRRRHGRRAGRRGRLATWRSRCSSRACPTATAPSRSACARASREANARIHERLAQPRTQRAGMGTTLTAAYVGEDDAHRRARRRQPRCYRLRDGDARAPHRRPLARRGARAPAASSPREEADEHPQRSIITRALGPEAERRGRRSHVRRRATGDVFLICSDGLTSMVPEAEVGRDPRAAPAAGRRRAAR